MFEFQINTYVAKTKTLISCAVTAQLICTLFFTYADGWFSHDAAQMAYYNITSTQCYGYYDNMLYDAGHTLL